MKLALGPGVGETHAVHNLCLIQGVRSVGRLLWHAGSRSLSTSRIHHGRRRAALRARDERQEPDLMISKRRESPPRRRTAPR